MFNRNKFRTNHDDGEGMFYGICALGFVAIAILGYVATKQDAAETKQALAEGRKVVYLFGQKAII